MAKGGTGIFENINEFFLLSSLCILVYAHSSPHITTFLTFFPKHPARNDPPSQKQMKKEITKCNVCFGASHIATTADLRGAAYFNKTRALNCRLRRGEVLYGGCSKDECSDRDAIANIARWECELEKK